MSPLLTAGGGTRVRSGAEARAIIESCGVLCEHYLSRARAELGPDGPRRYPFQQLIGAYSARAFALSRQLVEAST